jgi:hypothetical protein
MTTSTDTAPTNDQVFAEVDAIFAAYLAQLTKLDAVAARCTQPHCVGILNLVKQRMLIAAALPKAEP